MLAATPGQGGHSIRVPPGCFAAFCACAQPTSRALALLPPPQTAACGARAAPPTPSTQGCAWRRRGSQMPLTPPRSPQARPPAFFEPVILCIAGSAWVQQYVQTLSSDAAVVLQWQEGLTASWAPSRRTQQRLPVRISNPHPPALPALPCSGAAAWRGVQAHCGLPVFQPVTEGQPTSDGRVGEEEQGARPGGLSGYDGLEPGT